MEERERAAADLLGVHPPLCTPLLGADTRYSYLRSGSRYLYVLDGAQEGWMCPNPAPFVDCWSLGFYLLGLDHCSLVLCPR